MVVMLCGNKTDLVGGRTGSQSHPKRQVKTKEAEWFARRNGLYHMETSAKTGHHVREMFVRIAKALPDEEKRVLRARLEACRLQMQILDLETSLRTENVTESDRTRLEARCAAARQKLEHTGRSRDVVGRSGASLSALMAETTASLENTTKSSLSSANGTNDRTRIDASSSSGGGCC